MKATRTQTRKAGTIVGKVLPITDSHVVRGVIREQARRGDSSPTKTATKLILERLTLLEEQAGRAMSVSPSLPSPS